MPIRNVFRVLVLAALFTLPAVAQYEGTVNAKALFDQGEKALRSDHYTDAIADYKKALTLDPNFIEAHQQYIATRRREPYLLLRAQAEKAGNKPTDEQLRAVATEAEKQTRTLAAEYEALVREHPSSAVYPWALGNLYEYSNAPRQEEYCGQAVRIDPRFAPGYKCLATTAYNRGDQKLAIQYQRRVTELQPDSPDELLSYTLFLDGDPAAYKGATDAMVRKFPTSRQSAVALYWYAEHQTTDAAQAEAFEKLRKLFPPDKFDWSVIGMTELFQIYDRTDPAKALAFAHEMLAIFPKDDDWSAYAAYSDALAKALLKMRDNPAQALAIIEPMKPPSRWMDTRRKDLLQARALDLSGQTAGAYSYLLGCYAKHPTDDVRTAIGEYARNLGKTPQERDAGIWSAIADHSSPAIPFSLPNFIDGNLVSLENYRGHVVMVDFWYPQCGPCREAFPFLQQIAVKYRRQGAVVLAINAHEEEEADVVPLFKSKGYVPLRASTFFSERRIGD
jgi:thiol-disulfide isomerase/thioredoxin/Tfp pilus assembly protein PilF